MSSTSEPLAVRYFDDRVLFNDTEAWAYFRLPTISYECTTEEQREGLATNITIALAAIRMENARIHLRIAHRPYPAGQWSRHLEERVAEPGPGWMDYLEEMYRHVWAKDFWTKEVYLGVRLGMRGAQARGGDIMSHVRATVRDFERAMGLVDHQVRAPEIERWTEASERIGRALGSGALSAQHATADEIAWLFEHTIKCADEGWRPSASGSRTWGRGEVEQLAEGIVVNGRTALRLVQPKVETYVAYLSFAKFPDLMAFPDGDPWLFHADTLLFPVEVSARMELLAPAQAAKDVGRKLAHARDMDAHIREAGVEAPIALAEQIDAARMLEHGITKERLPFIYGWYRLRVTAGSLKLLEERVDSVMEHYRDIGIDVVRSTGDQFSLLNESLPGDRLRVKAYAQRQPLRTLAGGMPTATVSVGDQVDMSTGTGWIGPYIGETVGQARSIVHFDPLVAAARNRPPAVAVTGEPGGGKTTLALLMIYQLAMRGVTVVAIDPKGDAESLVELLQHQGHQARTMSLAEAQPGLLDPFAFGDDLAAKKTMATETLRLLLPRMSEDRESAMIQAVNAVANQPNPSLMKVVDYLKAQTDDAPATNLGAVLGSMAEMQLASLCFDSQGETQIQTQGWTTVFTLRGLSLPQVSTHQDDYSYQQRLSVALLYLVSQFARRLMNELDRRLPKAIFLDEAWAVTSTPEGAKLIPEVSRMGRSRNTALILVSQNAGDLLSEAVTNCLSSVFAFRSSEATEVSAVMELLGVEDTSDHRDALRGLYNGQCLYRDLDGRTAQISVDLVSQRLLEWLDTNPTRQRPALEEDEEEAADAVPVQ